MLITIITKDCQHNSRSYQCRNSSWKDVVNCSCTFSKSVWNVSCQGAYGGKILVTLGNYSSLSHNLTEEEEQQNRSIKLILNFKCKLQHVSVSCKIYNNNMCQKKKKICSISRGQKNQSNAKLNKID